MRIVIIFALVLGVALLAGCIIVAIITVVTKPSTEEPDNDSENVPSGPKVAHMKQHQDINECESEPCQNNGTCTDLVNGYSCQCIPGYTGGQCETDTYRMVWRGGCTATTPVGGQRDRDCISRTTTTERPGRCNGSDVWCSYEINECDSGPCKNNGTCTDLVNRYSCKCLPGYTGAHCEKDINECDSEPCKNTGSCTDLVNSYSCQCIQGYTGGQCETDINECESQPCQNNGSCTDLVNSYSCHCLPGYTGNQCEIEIDECESQPCQNNGTCVDQLNRYKCQCMAGFTGAHCEKEIDECNSQPCQNNGTCVDLVNSYICKCIAGYNGGQCENEIDECYSQPCQNNGTCVDLVNSYSCKCIAGYNGGQCENEIDECDSQPCQNNGTCVDLLNSYSCKCIAGYNGDQCEKEMDECDSQPCQNNGTCFDLVNSFSCKCIAGYTGVRCEKEIDECDSQPCQNNGSCIGLVNSFRCHCIAGYTGAQCQEEIDECASRPCYNDGNCTDLLNDYVCHCSTAYTGAQCELEINWCDPQPCLNGGNCTSLPKGYQCHCPGGYSGDMCETEIDECDSQPCQNNGTCVDLVNNYSCQCIAGFTGDQCEEEINECDSQPCQNNGSCVDLVNAYSCHCIAGYTGAQCQEEIDECQSRPCYNDGNCTDLLNGYVCHCPTAYTGAQCEVDIDDCVSEPCQNRAKCVDKVNGYQCQCLAGYTGTQCEQDINDCKPNPCLYNGTCQDFPNGFICHCERGYSGNKCQWVPYNVDIHLKHELFEQEMEIKDSPAYKKVLEKFKSVIDELCKFFPKCEVEHLRKGSVVMDLLMTSSEYPHDILENALQTQLPPGMTGVELGEIHVHEAGPCERYTPCLNNGTCKDLGRFDYECCCAEDWTGKNCGERALPPKPFGPQLECINDLQGDEKGLNYFGTRSVTTSGRKCQSWSAQYPHQHPYSEEPGLDHNYCRNRVHGIKGLLGPWCYTEDKEKEWEYCDNIPYCSNPDEIFPEPPASPGCYNKLSKGVDYAGLVYFAKKGRRCLSWSDKGYSEIDGNYCRNPGKTRNKPWCWTRDGQMEDCDIPVCSLPPPSDKDPCKVDTSVSSCESKVVLKGHCYYKFSISDECGFTVVAVNRHVFDVYMPDVVKVLHWRGIHGATRYTSRRCNVVFEVTDFGEITVRQPICGWCATKTLQSYTNDVKYSKKTCPVPLK